jgi:hypothetical protein
MSLINIKNFVQPVVDKRNLVTIVLIAGLFGIIRLSGGKAGMAGSDRRISDETPHSAISKEVAPDIGVSTKGVEKSSSSPQPLAKSKSKPAERVRGGDPLIDGVIGDTERAEPKKKGNKPANGRLDDIEETLGMR